MAVAASSNAPAVQLSEVLPPSVDVEGDDAPVKTLDGKKLQLLGQRLVSQFDQYKSDRRLQELRWMRNLRQYLGYYDPEVLAHLSADRSQAYPKITRVKCISMLSRVMDLMFPSDDRNWTLKARPSPRMDIADVKEAVQAAVARDTDAQGNGPQVDDDYVQAAVAEMAATRARDLMTTIDDQLQELGGDQSYDYVTLNKQAINSGIIFGLGGLAGPFAREVKTSTWKWDPKTGAPVSTTTGKYMPVYEFVRCWDYYPDMSAKRLEDGDGYFLRRVMSKRQLRDLAKRSDFFGDVIKKYLATHDTGNYRAMEFESELRSMGTKANVNEMKGNGKYELRSWHGPVDGAMLRAAGVDVPDNKVSDQFDAEVWLLDNFVVKAVMNPWVKWGERISTFHAFIFDHDDTSPIGFGLPNIMRDTQMSISGATRMMLDNASVVCGPMLELNTSLLRADQDLTRVAAYKTWYRDDDGLTTANAAVREINVESHIDDLEKIIQLFMSFGDMETFVGAATGGDMSKMPSEPMRNAAGASMLMGNAALPFKDIIRNFDRLTTSVIQSMVAFNRVLNDAPVADYDVIARGATSLIAKEVRGMQLDSLAVSLKDEDMVHVDRRKLLKARFDVRDAGDMLLSEGAAKKAQAAQDAAAAAAQDLQTRETEATIRNTLANAYKAITQGSKNNASANAAQVDAALDVLARDAAGTLQHAQIVKTHAETANTLAQIPGPTQAGAPTDGPAEEQGAPGGADPTAAGGAPYLPAPGGAGLAAPGGGDTGAGLLPPGGLPGAAGQGQGLA